MLYRYTAKYAAAVRIARAQKRAMRHRVAALENVKGTPLRIRVRREVRS